MFVTLGIYLLVAQSTAQLNCAWEDFNLTGAVGYEIQCVEPSGEYAIGYTPCMSYALCSGERYQATYFNRFNGQCQYYLAKWDDGETEPQFNYDTDGIQQWTFYYENGQVCNGEDRDFTVNWKCDPNAQPFSTNTTCNNDPDECLTEITILSSYACVDGPPPDTECKWGNFDLTSLFESNSSNLPILCNDASGKSYTYTPCLSASSCNGQQFQATLFDENMNSCKSLSQWDYGETLPSYFNNGGIPAWIFNYKNGEQTSECPDGTDLRIQWECEFDCQPWCLDTQCSQSGECGYSLTIKSALACKLPSDNLNKNETEKIVNKMKMLMKNKIIN